MDLSFEGVRLDKWSVLVRRAKDIGWEKNLVQNFVCSQLLELIESHNVRHFVAYNGKLDETIKGILVCLHSRDYAPWSLKWLLALGF